MGNIISSIKDCFNKTFSSSKKEIKKEEFNLNLLSEKDKENINNNIPTQKSKKMVQLLDIKESNDENNNNNDNNNLLSPKNSNEKYKDKDAYQSKDFKSKITLDDFQTVKVLGTGAFGKVSLVYNEELKRYFAMKALKKEYIKKNQQTRHTKEERKILETIDYPFISKLYYAFQTKKSLYMITEFMAGGEMFHHLHDCGHFDENRTRFYIAELVLAIDHLHKHNI